MDVLRAIAKIWHIMDRQGRIYVIGLLVLMSIASFVELLGLSTIPLFLGVLTRDAANIDVPVVGEVAQWFEPISRRELVTIASLALAGAFLIQMLFLSTLTFFKTRFIARLIHTLSYALFVGYVRAPFQYHATRHSSVGASRITMETARTANQFVYPLLHMVQSGLLMIAITTFVIVMSPLSTVIVLVGLTTVAISFMLFMRRRAQSHGRILTRMNAKITEDVGEVLGCLKHIRLRGLEPRFEAAFEGDSRARAQAFGFQRFISEFPKPVLEGAAVMGLIAIVFALLGPDASIDGIIPVLGLIGASIARVLPHVNQVTTWILSLYQHSHSAESIADDVLQLRAAGAYAYRSDAMDDHDGPVLTDRMVFDHVSYSYPDASEPSVKAVNLEIRPNTAVAFVGPTGAGKSTMVDLFCGLIEPTEGHIRVDGDGLQARRQAWQRRIGYIPQAIFIANRTLRENIALGMAPSEIDDTRVWSVLAQAQLDDFVAGLPEGLATHVGENGVRLSGGQRQRIGIARALYHDPEILVLDEATAALDNETERRLMDAIEAVRESRTLIMIAHRLSSIRNCDEIFVMENGAITGRGTYEHLLETNATFWKMAA